MYNGTDFSSTPDFVEIAQDLEGKDLSGRSDPEQKALRRVKDRVEKLRRSATATHHVGKDDTSTIRMRQREALSAVRALLEETDDPYLEVVLEDLMDAIDGLEISRSDLV